MAFEHSKPQFILDAESLLPDIHLLSLSPDFYLRPRCYNVRASTEHFPSGPYEDRLFALVLLPVTIGAKTPKLHTPEDVDTAVSRLLEEVNSATEKAFRFGLSLPEIDSTPNPIILMIREINQIPSR